MQYTTIYLMRHGEVDNPNGVLYGRLPGYGLTQRGQKMVQMSANYLLHREADLALILASPLLRAQQSAQPAGKLFSLPVLSDQRLMEAGNVFAGQQVHQRPLALAHPKWWKYYVSPFRPSWGEPYVHVAQRMCAVISETLDRVAGREALLVTHQSPIVSVRRLIDRQSLGHLPTHRNCSLASLTSLTFYGHTLVSVGYAEPALELLGDSYDMVPGRSAAKLKK